MKFGAKHFLLVGAAALSVYGCIIVIVSRDFRSDVHLASFYFDRYSQAARSRLMSWYGENLGNRGLQRELGFETGFFRDTAPSGTYPWGITSISPERAFARAGVNLGDVPVVAIVDNDAGQERQRYLWYHGPHDARGKFYMVLREHRGRTVHFGVVSRTTLIRDVDKELRMIAVFVPDE